MANVRYFIYCIFYSGIALELLIHIASKFNSMCRF